MISGSADPGREPPRPIRNVGTIPEDAEVGYDIPARPGMAEGEVQTPCLILDLDALERNVVRMGALARVAGVAHRSHGKMHKSVDVQLLQQRLGGAVGVCCQKVSEAEAFVRGGIRDVLVSNEVTDPAKIDRLARLTLHGAALAVCVDDSGNVADLSAACVRHGTELRVLVEIDCGAGRCGVTGAEAALTLARAVEAAPGLRFGGLQAYQGSLQHIVAPGDRRAAAMRAAEVTRNVAEALVAAGLPCATISGGGTGSVALDAELGVLTEWQAGSYAFMDAHYGWVGNVDGARLDATWENALFVLTSVMSHAKPDRAVCDAGLKAMSLESGLPVIAGRTDVTYVACSDEHGEIDDLGGVLSINERLRLIPGHCDPTCNLHDWYVGMRGGVVEVLWPVSARGKVF